MHGQPLSIRELEEIRNFQAQCIASMDYLQPMIEAVGMYGGLIGVNSAREMSDRIMRAAEELIDIRKCGRPIIEVEIEGERPSTNPKRLGQAPF